MEDEPALQAELVDVRRQLAELTIASAAHKRQLSEAKAKAKAVIQRKMEEAGAKLRILEDQNKLQSEELASLKPMVRQLDSDRNSLSEKCRNLETQLQQLHTTKSSLEDRCVSFKADLDAARESSEKQKQSYVEKDLHQQQDLKALRSQLETLKQSPSVVNETEPPELDDAPNGDSSLEDHKQLVEQLLVEREQLRAENETLREQVHANSEKSATYVADDSVNTDSLQQELLQSKTRIEALTQELRENGKDTETKQNQLEGLIRETKASNESLREQISVQEDRVKELLANLEKSELALQEERENVIRERTGRHEADVQEENEKSKILEAKVSEMERVVASKQAEIGKVREKAKTYLRELNAEKRAMESKMKGEAHSLRKELEEERNKIHAAEQRAESASSEVDNCLTLIRDKQKNIQMLQMTIATQKSIAEEAARETKSVREEFDRYKERARLALRGKDAEVESVDERIEGATASLRTDLKQREVESNVLKSRLRSLGGLQMEYDAAVQRAERAEAAADLLRKDATGMSNTNYTLVDELEDKLSKLEADLSSARVATDNAESQLETMKMRLEATEKALRGAEIRAEETERVSQKTIESQESQIKTMEKELSRARESAASAQRTAAAAAKALASSSSENGEARKVPNRKIVDAMEDHDREINNTESFESPSALKGGRTTLAAAMAGHSQDFGFQGNFDSPRSSSQALDSELYTRDRQISLLTSQIADLGALLDDAQRKEKLESEQTKLFKDEIKHLDGKLAAAEKLQNGAPFKYLRTIVVRYLETDDATLLPVIANVLSFTDEESRRVKARRGGRANQGSSSAGGYFGLNGLLGSRG